MIAELDVDLQHVLRHTSQVWPILADSNVLLTGASGFVGSWLVETFLRANQDLHLSSTLFVLTRNPQAFKEDKRDFRTLIGDLKTFAMPEVKFDYIIHAAFQHQTYEQSPLTTRRDNLQGVRRILRVAREHGTKKILLTSSGAIYGEQPADLLHIPEDYTCAVDSGSLYADVKRAAENAFAECGTDAVIGRLFAFVGPHLPTDKNFAVGNFIRDAASAGPIRIAGDGTAFRSYLYAADLAIWLWTLLIHGQAGRAYNVGSDQAVSILELARTVERVCGVTQGMTIAKVPIPGEKPKRYVPSIERARAELNLEPLIPLDEGVRRMFRWYKQRYTSTK
jgi:dTDP-glucose 4,6-dehydratase